MRRAHNLSSSSCPPLLFAHLACCLSAALVVATAYWGAPRGFTMEKYLERDEIMEKEEWGADNQLITW